MNGLLNINVSPNPIFYKNMLFNPHNWHNPLVNKEETKEYTTLFCLLLILKKGLTLNFIFLSVGGLTCLPNGRNACLGLLKSKLTKYAVIVKEIKSLRIKTLNTFTFKKFKKTTWLFAQVLYSNYDFLQYIAEEDNAFGFRKN